MRDLRKKNADGRTPTTGATGVSTSRDREKGIAIVTTVGIAVAVSLAFVAAGAVFERGQAPAAKVGRRPGAGPAQHPTQSYEAGELLLR